VRAVGKIRTVDAPTDRDSLSTMDRATGSARERYWRLDPVWNDGDLSQRAGIAGISCSDLLDGRESCSPTWRSRRWVISI
jgi:hypothetical protein